MWSQDLRLFLALLDRIRFEERSLYRAKMMLGNEENFGWALETYLLTAITNAVNTQVKGKKLAPSQRVNTPRIIRKKARGVFDAKKPVRKLNLAELVPSQS